MTRYEVGFMNKCAEYGLGVEESVELMKSAKSTPLSEALLSIPGDAAMGAATGGLGEFISLGAGINGIRDGLRGSDAGDRAIGNASGAWNLVPTVGMYRLGRRHGVVARKMNELSKSNGRKAHPVANIVSEYFAPLTSTATAAAAGGILGKLLRNGNAGMAAAVAGTGLAHATGALAGLLRKRRTDDQQFKAESGKRALLKYFVPGAATYDSIARLGKSRDYLDDRGRSRKSS